MGFKDWGDDDIVGVESMGGFGVVGDVGIWDGMVSGRVSGIELMV